jgi:cathepsin D
MSSGLIDGRLSGVLGLGFEMLSHTGYKPWWMALSDQGAWTAPEMSFYLNRQLGNPYASDYEEGGVVTLGGRNPNYYTGQFEWASVIGSAWWQVPITKVTVQGNVASIASGGRAIIEPSTGLIGGPSRDVANIWSRVSGAEALTSAIWEGFYTFRACPFSDTFMWLILLPTCQLVIPMYMSLSLLVARAGPSLLEI